jgi:hypothetical protein
MVLVDGVERVAQYGQWDHYPSGQGLAILSFCKRNLRTRKQRAEFAEKVRRCGFISDAEVHERWASCGAKPDSEFVSVDIAAVFNQKYPSLSRDTGGKILDLILAGETRLTDSKEFIHDSLFCEWAYCVNLDTGMLEVYKGFQKAPHDKGRYSGHVPEPETYPNGSTAPMYFACALVAEFPLGKLPSKARFLAELEPATEE